MLWSSSNFDHQVGRSGEEIAAGPRACSGRRGGEAGDGSRVFTTSMLTVHRLISLTVVSSGSARVTGIGASYSNKLTNISDAFVPIVLIMTHFSISFVQVKIALLLHLQQPIYSYQKQ